MSDVRFRAFLSDFQVLRPEYKNCQEYGVDWLTEAHTKAEERAQKDNRFFDAGRFKEQMRKFVIRFGCGPDRIGSRGHALDDFCHLNWEQMRIFRLHEIPEGAGLDVRTQFYDETVGAVFEKIYPVDSEGPEDLIHVTCTGYVAPSGAQKIVARRGWHRTTTVTHAYHMGCYAAIPALRMAEGFLASSCALNGRAARRKKRADIVHTELCTIHMNPAVHTAEQLVLQSLFGDGFIRYAVLTEEGLAARPSASLELLALHEEVVPETAYAMTYQSANWGMQMGLAKEVPALIAGSLERFLDTLFAQAGLSFAEQRKKAVFAVHPGGPKIIEKVQESLALRAEQVETSKQILFDYGNMSSATLPHVWERIVRDDAYPAGTLVASLAFGPGLSVCGNLLRKV